MTEVVTKQELDEAFAMFYGMAASIKDEVSPAVEIPDEDRIAAFKQTFLKSIDNNIAVQLDACIHCGACAQACQFYIGTKDPKYTPIRKLDLLKRVYQRELSPMNWMLRWVTNDITIDDLNAQQELVYDSCTMCGRCNLVCPAGINIADMVALNRSAMAAAGMMPDELRFMQEGQAEDGTIFGADEDLFMFRIMDLQEKLGFEIPVNKLPAEVLVTTSGLDIHLFRDALGGTIETLHHMGVDFTLMTDGYETANFGLLSGHEATKKKMTRSIVDAALKCQARIVIVPECGHTFPAIRFGAAEAYGQPVPFETYTVSEYFGRAVMDGRLTLEKDKHKRVVALHDPCKVGRWGGVFDEPRAILEAIGWELHETESSKQYNFCCGGGAGNFLIERADKLKRAGYRVKMNEIEATGAESLVVSCGSCRMNFEVGKVKAGDSLPVDSLAAIIAAHLPKTAKEGAQT
ncbi:(Fe-S)-binding protein [Sagittula sp. S175]|uniref:(Fe-S)-binding protein n=1 Tax=Sagittula sp. S175 TaxID=3415129 RepID=UPI003C7AFA1C